MKYKFTNEDKTKIEYFNGMRFEILLNPIDGEDYDAWNDTYQEFEFLGNHIVCLMLNPDEFQPEPEPIGWGKIHAINRKAFQWYRSQVKIERYTQPEGPREDERYLLQEGQEHDWILTDKENLIVFSWENKKFSETQKITPLDESNLSISEIPRIMREAGGWLVNYHRNKI
jgi:hypothetical protein